MITFRYIGLDYNMALKLISTVSFYLWPHSKTHKMKKRDKVNRRMNDSNRIMGGQNSDG